MKGKEAILALSLCAATLWASPAWAGPGHTGADASVAEKPLIAAEKQAEASNLHSALANIFAGRATQSSTANQKAPLGQGWENGNSAAPSGFNVLEGLALCCGLFFIMLYALKRLNRGKLGAGTRRMKVLERLALSSKTALLMVEVDGRSQILALGAERVEFLGTTARFLPLKARARAVTAENKAAAESNG